MHRYLKLQCWSSDNDDLCEVEDFKDLEIAVLNPRSEVSGVIPDRKGKIFTNITTLNRDSYINRYQPGLSNQPNLFLQNWNITQAKMVFENISAVNYTKSIETDPTEFIMSYSITDPIIDGGPANAIQTGGFGDSKLLCIR